MVRPLEGEETKISLADMGTLLVGLATQINGSVMQKLGDFDVVTLFCDWRGIPVSGSFGWREHTRVGARHLAQTEVSLPRKKNAWARVITAKVQGQAQNLRLMGDPDWGRLSDLADHVRSGDPNNVEGQAARYYWSRVFAGDRLRREPGVGADARNSLLDYGYTILRGHAVRAVLEAGLSPTLGLFHRGRSNYFNLADDLLEPFRPAIDFDVAQFDTEMSSNHPAVRHALVRSAGQPFQKSGKTIPTCLTELAQQLGRYFEGDVERLSVPHWTGPQVAS